MREIEKIYQWNITFCYIYFFMIVNFLSRIKSMILYNATSSYLDTKISKDRAHNKLDESHYRIVYNDWHKSEYNCFMLHYSPWTFIQCRTSIYNNWQLQILVFIILFFICMHIRANEHYNCILRYLLIIRLNAKHEYMQQSYKYYLMLRII